MWKGFFTYNMHVVPDYVLFGMQLNQCQTVFENSQVVRVQENSSSLEAGRQARQIAVIVQDDLVNSVRPGENVIVTGKCRCICCGAGAYTRACESAHLLIQHSDQHPVRSQLCQSSSMYFYATMFSEHFSCRDSWKHVQVWSRCAFIAVLPLCGGCAYC